jgi:hypothetical protein
MEICLWKIFVPTISAAGKPIRLRFHRVWDAKVMAITGGLTINAPIHGRWVSPLGVLYAERMIPVEIACTEEQIKDIHKMTKAYYNQEKVMYAKLSNYVVIE